MDDRRDADAASPFANLLQAQASVGKNSKPKAEPGARQRKAPSHLMHLLSPKPNKKQSKKEDDPAGARAPFAHLRNSGVGAAIQATLKSSKDSGAKEPTFGDQCAAVMKKLGRD